jgi:hypothetical protein
MDRDTHERTTIPAIMIVCEHCGFISQHALQPLGVWPHHETQIDNQSPQHSSASRA